MLKIRGMRHIKSNRNLYSFRSIHNSTGFSMKQIEQERLEMYSKKILA
ncbi:MAG: hypothetical protein KKD38_09505 [Candidatus Delongbacteria bacterium]|nr:hypothetical protein [Candidatus Delongbacteria bacterium]MCG2759651.1 hypothetical protein [Candidatus Delongbacteria bacterium]